MNDRFNTIAGWALFAGIIALGTSIVSGEIFHAERPEKMGYPIEGVELEGEGGAAAEQPIAVYLAKADPAAGPLPIYRTRRNAGHLQPDPAQELAAAKLQSLHNALRNYEPAAGSAGWRERLGLGRRKADPT